MQNIKQNIQDNELDSSEARDKSLARESYHSTKSNNRIGKRLFSHKQSWFLVSKKLDEMNNKVISIIKTKK